MKKIAKVLASFAALAFVLVPVASAGAVEVTDGIATVSTEDELFEAVGQDDVNHVIMKNDIILHKSLVISRPIVMDGGGHALHMVPDHAGEEPREPQTGAYYVIKVYNQPVATTTIQNIGLDGGAAGIQNNGSNVTLKGSITFANNEWGGMEMTKGDGITSVPVTNFTDVKIVNSSETAGQPTVWTDKLKADEINITFDGAQAVIFKDQDAGQVQFFLDNTNAQKALEDTDLYSELDDSPMADVKVEIGGVPTPEPTPGDDTDTDTPEVTEPVKDEEAPTDEADVAAPNTGTTIANFALVLTGITVAVLTAVYATRFASAKK